MLSVVHYQSIHVLTCIGPNLFVVTLAILSNLIKIMVVFSRCRISQSHILVMCLRLQLLNKDSTLFSIVVKLGSLLVLQLSSTLNPIYDLELSWLLASCLWLLNQVVA